MLKRAGFVLIFVLSLQNQLWAAPAAGEKSSTEGFEYPELLVTPRATERLEMEAKQELGRRWTLHLPYQLPGLVTFTAGLMQSSYTDLGKDPDKSSAMAGIVVGGGWLVATTILALSSTPYTDAWAEVQALPKGSRREQLMRERMAEEAIGKQARLASRLKWLSVLSNAGAGIYMVAKSQSDSFGRLMDGAAILVALTPILFKHTWIDVYSQQESYKKRIYGPVAQAGWTLAEVGGKVAPAVALTVRF